MPLRARWWGSQGWPRPPWCRGSGSRGETARAASVPPCRVKERALFSAGGGGYLGEQGGLRGAVPEPPPQPFLVRLFYSTYFYLSLASGLGALVAWAMLEPFFDEHAEF